MKKLKMLTMTVFTLIVLLIPLTSFANPCCDLWITSVNQDDNGIITVDYSALNPLPNREVEITVSTDSYTNRRQLYRDVFYISNDSFDGEDTVYTFDGSFLLEGETYVINLCYTYCCENYHCSYVSVEEKITIKEGIPSVDYDEIIDGMLELIGESKAVVKITAPVAGMYDFYISSDKDIDVENYSDDGNGRMGLSYYSQGESRMFLISDVNGGDLSAEIFFEKIEEIPVEPETINPTDKDICFKFSNIGSLVKFNITKKGIYQFDITDDDEYTYFQILDEKGMHINSADGCDSSRAYLKEGTYFVNAMQLTDVYSMTVSYVVPEELSFGKVYAPVYDIQGNGMIFYKMTLLKPAIVTINNQEEIMCRLYRSEYDDFFYGEEKVVLDAGEYYFCLYNQVTEGAEVYFDKSDFESVSLDTSYIPVVSENDYYYYFAFCAPEKGKYEFDFTKYEGYYWFGEENNGSGMDYYVKELNKGEWVLVGMYNASEIKVCAYTEPVAVEIKYEETAYFDFVSGKTFIYSFTPEEDGMYKLYTENTYSKSIKVWTDDEVLFETDDNRWYSIDRNYELKKDVPVYVSFSGDGDTYEEKSSVTFKSPYTEIKDGTNISVSAESDVITYYVAKESGYYKFDFSRSYGSTADVIVDIKGNTYNIYNDYYKEVMIYLEKDEKLIVTFKKFNDEWLPDVYITVTYMNVTELIKDTSYIPESGTHYIFVPENDGAYKLTFPAEFRVMVSSGDKEYISLGGYNEQYFAGEEGSAYILYVTANNYPSENDNTSYNDLRVTEESSKSVNVNESYTTTDDFEILTFEIEEDGLYRIDNEICNVNIFIFYEGQWVSVVGEYSSLFNLEKGTNYIIVQPKESSDNYQDLNTEYIDDPYATIKIYKTVDTNKVGISVADAFASPSGGGATLVLCITSPADVVGFEYGVEYLNDSGETVIKLCGYESMYASDKRYVIINPYFADWSIGDSVTLRPFMYLTSNEDDIIYGEQTTVTFNLLDDITPLNYKTTNINLKSCGKYGLYFNDYWYSFTQPVTDETATYIEVLNSFSDFELFDDTYNYVASYQDIEGNVYYELESGKVYYLRVRATFDDSEAYIRISSLAETGDSADILSDVKIDDKSVSFIVSANENCKAYVAAYDKRGALLELKTIKNPYGSYNMKFEDATIYTFKIMILNNKIMPLCSSVYKSVN